MKRRQHSHTISKHLCLSPLVQQLDVSQSCHPSTKGCHLESTGTNINNHDDSGSELLKNNAVITSQHQDLENDLQPIVGSPKNCILPVTCWLSKKQIRESCDELVCGMCQFKTSRQQNLIAHLKRIHWRNVQHLPISSFHTNSSLQSTLLNDDSLSCVRSSPSQSTIWPSSDTFPSTNDNDDDMNSNVCKLPDIVSSPNEGELKEGDLVWVKAYKYPFWPAVINKMYKQKTKRKVSVVFLENASFLRPFSVSGKNIQKNIMPYGKDAELQDRLEREACQSRYGESARRIIDKLEEYLSEKRQGKVSCSILQYLDSAESESRTSTDKEDESSIENALNKSEDEFSSRLKSCLEKRYKRCQLLLECCESPAIKDHMKGLLSGDVHSYRSQLFQKNSLKPSEKLVLHNVSFGPIEDEEQQNKLVDILRKQYISISPIQTYQDMKYFTEVILPECIIYAIQLAFRRPRHKAEQMYSNGFILSKEEHKQERDLLSAADGIKNKKSRQEKSVTCRLGLKLS